MDRLNGSGRRNTPEDDKNLFVLFEQLRKVVLTLVVVGLAAASTAIARAGVNMRSGDGLRLYAPWSTATPTKVGSRNVARKSDTERGIRRNEK